RRAHQEHPPLVVRVTSLGAAETNRDARQSWRLRIAWVERHIRFVSELLDAKTRDLAPAPPTRRERHKQDREGSCVGEPGARASRGQTVQDVSCHGALALAPAWPWRGAHRQPQRRAQARRAERTLDAGLVAFPGRTPARVR